MMGRAAVLTSILLGMPAAAGADQGPQAQFFAAVQELCGQAFAGNLVSAGSGPNPFADQTMVMHVRECSTEEIRIPFHIGDNRSRTWVLRRTASGLELKHDHRHEDGSEEAVSWYGGHTLSPGTATLQAFPVDEESREMFIREGRDQSLDNTWYFGLNPGEQFSYRLSSGVREFAVEFDLRQAVAAPPPPWGS